MKDNKHIKKPSLLLSLTPFISLIFLMLFGIIVLKSEPQIILIIAIVITTFIGKYLGYSWEDMENSMIESNKIVMQANFIIMIVGCLIGVWMSGGIVPGMIFYGLKLFTPNMFLLLLPIICSVIAMSTGSAWTAAGTIGIAAMGIGSGLGIPTPLTAGAVVTGACFGDKLSPLSDSTNLAAGVMGVNLFDHIIHMLYTVVPGFIVSLLIFGIIGLGYKDLNLHPKNLSRVLEGASPLVPWSTCGAVYMATLGISAFQYGKYYFLGIIVPIISIIYGFTGFKLERLNKDNPINNYTYESS